MQFEAVSIRIDRKTGKEISRESLGPRTVPDKEACEALTILLTGMTIKECCKKMKEDLSR